MVKLWIDDLKEPPDDSWTWEKTPSGARSWLFHSDPAYRPVELALDNDLGWPYEEGRKIADQILQRALDDVTYVPPKVLTCISANPVAIDAIEATFKDIKQVAEGR